MPAAFDPRTCDVTLFGALLRAARRHGWKKPILEDAERAPLDYRRLVAGALIFGRELARATPPRETVGLLLPNVNGLILTLFGLNAYGRRVALLNFTAGTKALKAATRMAELKTIVTSRRFVESAKLEDVVAALQRAGADAEPRIVYLEEMRRGIKPHHKLAGLIKAYFAAAVHGRHAMRADDAAVILFTSGTEGLPKGVVLSNGNLVANAAQIAAHAGEAWGSRDIVMNPLPMFHSFGLTAAGLMPLFAGMKTVLYPSPLHYKQVPQLIRAAKATILFATDTFMQGYARAAGDDDLRSVRYAVCGAERVKEATRKLWSNWGTIVLEGYGATECAPVIACNLPAANAPGTWERLCQGSMCGSIPSKALARAAASRCAGQTSCWVTCIPAGPASSIRPPRVGTIRATSSPSMRSGV